jgi:acetyltransferase EpsM
MSDLTNALRLAIVGAGGHGAELYAYVADLIRHGWTGEFLGYLDDAGVSQSAPAPVIGKLSAFSDRPPAFFKNLHYMTALGNNATRRHAVATLQRLYDDRLTPWTLVHPTSYVGACVDIGGDTCLAPGAIVTSRTRIGNHCILNVKVSVSHDCTIGDFVNLNPGATICGKVTIGDGAYIGAGATIRDRVTIGANSVVGAGAVVIDDVPADVTVVGVPGRVIKRHVVAV